MKPIELGEAYPTVPAVEGDGKRISPVDRIYTFDWGENVNPDDLYFTKKYRLSAVPLDSKYLTAQDVLDRLRPRVDAYRKTKMPRKDVEKYSLKSPAVDGWKLIEAFDALCAEVGEGE